MSQQPNCPRCGVWISPGIAFCPRCGHQLGSPPPPPAAPYGYPPPTAPHGYPPPPAPYGYPLPPPRPAPSSPPVLPLIGAAVTLIALFVPWLKGFGSTETANTTEIPAGFLFSNTADPSGVKLLVPLLIMALVGGGLAVVPGAGIFRRLLGGLVALTGLLFMGRVISLVTDLGGESDDAFRLIQAGPYIAIVGGILLMLGRQRKL